MGFLKERTHRFESGLVFLAATLVVAGVIALSISNRQDGPLAQHDAPS
jgi:hypothetical protein